MRRILAAALALVLALMLCACKSAEAKSVEAQIGQIGDVTLESAAAIEEAEASFAALTEEQKAEVKNYDVLLAARETYTGLKSEAAKRTEALIDAIGEVTADSRSAIGQAQAENNAALQAAHERFAAMKSAAVLELEARIGALGAVTLDSESAVEQAEAAFAALPEEEQRQVENQAVLLAARETLDAAKQELEAHYAVMEGKVGSDGTGYLPRMDGTMLEIRGDVVALWLLKDRKTAVVLERDGTLYTLTGEEKQTLAAEVSSVQTVRSSGVLYLDGEGYLYRQLFALAWSFESADDAVCRRGEESLSSQRGCAGAGKNIAVHAGRRERGVGGCHRRRQHGHLGGGQQDGQEELRLSL